MERTKNTNKNNSAKIEFYPYEYFLQLLQYHLPYCCMRVDDLPQVGQILVAAVGGGGGGGESSDDASLIFFFFGVDLPAKPANVSKAPKKISKKGANKTAILTGIPILRSRYGGAKYPKYASSIPPTRHKIPKPNTCISILGNFFST